MQKNYSIDVVDGITVTRFSKKPELSELIGAMDDVLARGESRLRLWVFEAGINFSYDEIVEIAKHGKVVWPVPSMAAIVVPDDLSFGLARVHDVYREQKGSEVRVFRTETEAIAWLKGEI